MKTKTEILKMIEDEDVQSIQVVKSSEDLNKCSVIIGDKMFSMMYETENDATLIEEIKSRIDNNVLFISYFDIELSYAWRISYLEGNIEKERWDRRVISHQYNEMNEVFCIDRTLKDEILEEGTFGNFDELPNWKKGIIRWYQRHII